jgi:serine protease Do
MKRAMLKTFLVAAGAFFLVPAIAQDEKDKVVEKDKKERKETEQIIIRRTGDGKDKMVIEIDGDKITINGKPIEKDGDVTVNRHKIKDALNYYMRTPGVGANGDAFRFFNEEANHAMLGVTTERVDQGAKVNDVTKESAAEKIGLKEGDIITKINETKIEDPDGLSKAIRAQKPGDKVQVTYLRDGKQQTATAELTKWKGNAFKFDMGDLNLEKIPFDVAPRVYQGHNFTWSGGQPKLGLSVQDTDDGKGVKVLEVDADSNAARAGVKENDIIQEIDGKAVNNTDEVVKIIKESKEKNSIKLKLTRDGKTQNIEVKMPKKIKTADL